MEIPISVARHAGQVPLSRRVLNRRRYEHLSLSTFLEIPRIPSRRLKQRKRTIQLPHPRREQITQNSTEPRVLVVLEVSERVGLEMHLLRSRPSGGKGAAKGRGRVDVVVLTPKEGLLGDLGGSVGYVERR